jgi:undecaprenyl-diphosphatase
MSLSQLNIDVFRSINDLSTQYSPLNPVVIFLAEYMLYVLCLTIAVFWFTRNTSHRLMVIHSLIAFAFAEILGKAAGLLYSHHQPFAVLPLVNQLVEHEVDNSFPSDHTILFFSICFSFFLVRKKEWWVWLVLPFCVAISRIWVGVHYPVDVIVGAIFGILSAFAGAWLMTKLLIINKMLTFYEKVEQRILPPKGKSESI